MRRADTGEIPVKGITDVVLCVEGTEVSRGGKVVGERDLVVDNSCSGGGGSRPNSS